MQAQLILFGACLIGAIGVYLLLSRRERALTGAGALLGLGAFGFLLVQAAEAFAVEGESDRPEFFYLMFTAMALIASLRMITTPRPVYAALYFVLVVLSSAGLFLLLAAEFMAFALVIVYAGAILVTYLFVLMLAQQSPSGQEKSQPEYDRVPREPAAAAAVGFVLLAVLVQVMVGQPERWPAPPTTASAERAAWNELELMPARLRDAVLKANPDFKWPPDQEGGRYLKFDRDGRPHVTGQAAAGAGGAQMVRVDLPPEAMPENIQRVGIALVAEFPVSLELAGVILTLAMFGSVVLARRQIELDEDEKRQAAGMRRLSPDSDEPGGDA
jgi:NADH-quinone oxidoreductase subunit J